MRICIQKGILGVRSELVVLHKASRWVFQLAGNPEARWSQRNQPRPNKMDILRFNLGGFI
jgi:hypothetical protein